MLERALMLRQKCMAQSQQVGTLCNCTLLLFFVFTCDLLELVMCPWPSFSKFYIFLHISRGGMLELPPLWWTSEPADFDNFQNDLNMLMFILILNRLTKLTEKWKHFLKRTSGSIYIGQNVKSKMAAVLQKLKFPFLFLIEYISVTHLYICSLARGIHF